MYLTTIDLQMPWPHAYVNGVPQVPGSQTSSLWHALTSLSTQVLQGTFINTETGKTFTLWNGDTITVVDANGWTAKFQWTPLSTIQWVLVPGSVRDQNGNIPATASTPARSPSAGSAEAGAATVATLPAGTAIYVEPTSDPLPHGYIIISTVDDGGGGFGGGAEPAMMDVTD